MYLRLDSLLNHEPPPAIKRARHRRMLGTKVPRRRKSTPRPRDAQMVGVEVFASEQRGRSRREVVCRYLSIPCARDKVTWCTSKEDFLALSCTALYCMVRSSVGISAIANHTNRVRLSTALLVRCLPEDFPAKWSIPGGQDGVIPYRRLDRQAST